MTTPLTFMYEILAEATSVETDRPIRFTFDRSTYIDVEPIDGGIEIRTMKVSGGPTMVVRPVVSNVIQVVIPGMEGHGSEPGS